MNSKCGEGEGWECIPSLGFPSSRSPASYGREVSPGASDGRRYVRQRYICTANYASVKGGAGQGQPSPAQPSLARPRLPAIGAAAVAPTPLRSPGAAPTATRPAPTPKGKAVPAAPRLGSGATAAYLRFEGVVNDGRHSATV